MHLVVFDADGTLVDSQAHIHAAMVETFTAFDHAPPAITDTRSIIGLTLDRAIACLLDRPVDGEVARMTRHYKNAFHRMAADPDMHAPLFPGIERLVDELAEHDDIFLAIASGKSRRGINEMLETHDLRGHFAAMRTADDCPSKPHPAMVLECCEEIGVDPADAVVVGDTSFDIEMARSAGAGAIGVAWGYHSTSDLVDAGAHTVVDDPGQIAAIVHERRRERQ